MSLDGRLNRLTPALSAKERGTLLLKALKGEVAEDPAWRATMPSSQTVEFNRYIGLMNTANVHVAHLITFVEKEVEKIELLMAWVATLRLWQTNLAEIEFCASLLVREPVTEGEHRRLVEKASSKLLTIRQAAEHVAEVQRAWSDDDLEEVPRVGALVVKDEAWARLCAEAESDVREVVAAGEIEAVGKGRGLRVRLGSLDSTLGRETKARPEWAGGYEVRPDAEEALIEEDRRTLTHLRQALTTRPLGVVVEGCGLASLIEVLEARVRGLIALRWRDARTAEFALDELAREFEGEDPLNPLTRAALDEAKQALRDHAAYFELYGPEVEFPEPTEEDMALAHELLERGRRLFG